MESYHGVISQQHTAHRSLPRLQGRMQQIAALSLVLVPQQWLGQPTERTCSETHPAERVEQ
jgi:hypothetical protein